MRQRQIDPDILAGHLLKWRDMARSMPPSWDGACVSPPILGEEGQRLGSILPGRGVYINTDLRSLGITRRIDGVYERSLVRRGAEALARARNATRVLLADERGTITTYDGIVNGRGNGNGQNINIAKASTVTVANQWSGTWQAGGNPGAGAYSATPGTAPDNTTAGALSLGISDPAGGNTQYFLTFGAMASSALNSIWLGDLLVQVGSITAASNASQTVSSATMTRNYAGTAGLGSGVNMTFDITTPLGATPANIVVTYTNQAGAGSRVTTATAMLASGIVQRLTPVALGPFMALQGTDFGVRSVQSVQLSASMGSGVYALNLWYPIAWLPGIIANVYLERDSTAQIDGIIGLVVGTGTNIGCLTMYAQANTTSTGVILGTMRTVQG